MMVFYAVTRTSDLELSLRKIPMDRAVQEQLDEQFTKQADQLIGLDCEPIDFSCQHRIEVKSSEVFCVSDFELPIFLEEAVSAPEGIDDLERLFTQEAPMIKAIVGVDANATSFYFQFFEKRRILDRSRVFIFSGQQFNELDYPAVVIDERLAASIVDGELRFKSFHRTNQFLDLSCLYSTATDPEVRQILEHPKLNCDVDSVFDSGVSNRMRRQFSNLIAIGILDRDNVTPDRIRNEARKYGGLESISVQIQNGNRSVLFPTEKRTQSKFLKFLCEELYVGDLTGDQRSANSTRVEVASDG